MSDEILVQQNGPVLNIVIHRPEKKNALTAAMYQALADGLRLGDADHAVRAIVIQGSANTFTAGNDLADFLANPPRDRSSPVLQFLEVLSKQEKPLIAAVEGAAVGVGTTMLLHCDFVYAGDSARFSLPFVNLGLCPEAASSFLLPLIAGHRRAATLLMLGEAFSATEAVAAGIATETVAAGTAVEHARSVARKLAEKPAGAIRTTKRLMRKQYDTQIAAALAEEIDAFARMLTEPAAREAIGAFLEKRKPDFSQLP
ncbi:MAG: enoyl-CoA hydratase [Betaproteobacteria bacterium]|nr:enoyl-CoA hydratase [Betaproteobacteria bacterium]